MFILWHFLAFSLTRKCPLRDSRTSFWEFLGPLIRNSEYWSQMYVFFAFFHLAADFSCAKLAFSKHVDNRPFHWSCSLAVLTVSIVFACFLFLTMNLSWIIFAVFNDLAWHEVLNPSSLSTLWPWKLCALAFSHFPKRVWWSFHVDNVLLVLARSVPLNKVCKRFIAVFVHPQVPGVRERVDSDSICHVFVCSVSWFLRAFNARAHASIYIYIYIYIYIVVYQWVRCSPTKMSCCEAVVAVQRRA